MWIMYEIENVHLRVNVVLELIEKGFMLMRKGEIEGKFIHLDTQIETRE